MPAWIICLRLIFAVAMLLLPGYLIARLGRIGARAWLAFPLSMVGLFFCIFWIHLCGFELTFGRVAVGEALTCAVLAGFAIWQTKTHGLPPVGIAHRQRWRWPDKALVLFGVLMVLILIWRTLMAPLAEFDTQFRWDFLAQQILRYGRYDYYPPLRPADFTKYFYVDAIPPMVSFSYWWLYAAAGAHWIRLTAIPVALQYISLLGLAYCLARRLGNLRAETFAVAVMGSSILLFRVIAMAQETGLTALAMAGMLFALSEEESIWGRCVVAGALGALAALSREYGWALAGCGVVALLPRDKRLRKIGLFGLVLIVLAGPWYVRTFILTGNPFYPLRFFGLNVNPVLARLLDFDRQVYGITKWSLGDWGQMIGYLLQTAPLQWTLGVYGLYVLCTATGPAIRRIGATCCAVVIVVILLWLFSVGTTNGGPWYSTRVLSPALLTLSITAGVGAIYLGRLIIGAEVLWVYAALCSIAAAWVYPTSVMQIHWNKWAITGAQPYHSDERTQHVAPLLETAHFPRSQRILSSDAFLYVALLPDGYLVTPPWDPDVKFLFDPQTSAAEASRRLRAMGITAVEFAPSAMNTIFLDRNSNFFHEVYHFPKGFEPIARIGQWGILLIPARP